MNEARFLYKGINESVSENSAIILPTTFAKVTKINENGSVIDVILVLENVGLSEYKNIPIIKNKYAYAPISEGDIVLLLPISHLLENFLEKEVIDSVINLNSYVCVPFGVEKDLKDFTNNFHLKTPKEKIKGEITEDIAKLESESSDLNISFKNIDIKGESIKIGNEADTIKTILFKLIDILVSSKTEMGGAGDAPHIHKSIDSSSNTSLQNLKNDIAQVFV